MIWKLAFPNFGGSKIKYTFSINHNKGRIKNRNRKIGTGIRIHSGPGFGSTISKGGSHYSRKVDPRIRIHNTQMWMIIRIRIQVKMIWIRNPNFLIYRDIYTGLSPPGGGGNSIETQIRGSWYTIPERWIRGTGSGSNIIKMQEYIKCKYIIPPPERQILSPLWFTPIFPFFLLILILFPPNFRS